MDARKGQLAGRISVDVRTVLVLISPDGRRVRLLRRSADKKLFAGLITGIGGKVELHRGEGDDIEASLWRELAEETGLGPEQVSNVRLRLCTTLHRDGAQVVLLWFTGMLADVRTPPRCTEGTLEWFDRDALPDAQMVPTAAAAIRFILDLRDDDHAIYTATYGADRHLVMEHRSATVGRACSPCPGPTERRS